MNTFLDGFIVGVAIAFAFFWLYHYVTVFKYYKDIVVKLSAASAAQQAQEQDTAADKQEKIPPAPGKNPIGFLWDGK